MIRYFILFYLLFSLASCNSTKIFYDYGDILVSWQVDNYFDLTNEQEEWIEGKIISNLDWHRKNELPDYKLFLVEIKELARDGITMKDLNLIFLKFEKKRDKIFEKITPDIALFLNNLSSNQINYFEKKILEDNEELMEELGSDQNRLKKRKEYFFKQMEDWFGELSKNQISKLSKLQNKWYRDSSNLSKNRMLYRLKSQRQFLSLLRSNPDKTTLEKWLREWTSNWTNNANPKRKKRILKNKKRILEVNKILTAEQRLFALKELDSWIKVFEETIKK